MKKRLFSFFYALILLFTPEPFRASAAVASSFSDVTDGATAAAVEALRVMGVLDGYSDGLFHPENSLNRAQFCKMVILATGTEKELGRYGVITVFPDVKPSHWAAAYINLAARGQNIIKGFSDGLFHPERTVTLGQAATILLRLLGYKDEDVGGVWPDGYMAVAESTGLADGVGSDGSAPLDRGRAAILFANLLRAETASGAALYALSDETTLTSFDGAAGTLVTADKTYDMEAPRSAPGLVGSRGQVVLKDGKALTFLPMAAGKTAAPAGAVIVQANRSTRGFASLTDGRDGYRIYKNGAEASAADLRTGDVATYSAKNNAVSVCDTRLTAYYENCYPSPDAPTTIELLNGTSFAVLPTAVDMLSAYKPGQLVMFLLTADGQIAGAMDADNAKSSLKTSANGANALRGNAVIINGAGGVRLLCGGIEIPVKCAVPESAGAAARLSWDDDKNPRFTALSNAVSGALDLSARKLGSAAFAENVRIYDGDGALLSLSDFNADALPSSGVTSSRADWAGKVDLIVLNGNPNAVVYYGRAEVKIDRTSEKVPVRDPDGRDPDDEDWEPTYQESSESVLLLTVECNGATLGPWAVTRDNVKTGDFVSARLNKNGDGFASVRALKKIDNVAFTAWTGKSAVSAGGTTYSVPENVLCYNRDNGRRMTLENAKAYAKRAALYVEDGIVRALEVKT